MRMTSILRTSLLATTLGAALSAHAVDIFLASSGTTALGATNTATEKVYSQVGGYGPLGSLLLTDDGFTGKGSYTGSGGELDFDYTFTGLTFLGPADSLFAQWTATGGTKTYQGATGMGTFALTTLGFDNPVPSGTVFAGDVEAVPEPASLCALGLGALGLLRRRKRA